MAARKTRAQNLQRMADQAKLDAAIARAREAREEKRRMEETLAQERASVLARRTITTVRPDGSRWTYTPPAVYTPRGKRGPQTADDMRAALEAIKPHRDPTPHKPESIERYAARMARTRALPDVGVEIDNGSRGEAYVGGRWTTIRDTYVRLPDDADEGAPRELADQIAADTALAKCAVALAAPASEAFDICALVAAEACPRCLGQTPGIPAGDPAHPYTGPLTSEVCAECATAIAHEASERAIAATVRAETRRAYFGAGAYSRRTRIPVIPATEAA